MVKINNTRPDPFGLGSANGDGYDGLDRLKTFRLAGSPTVTVDYDQQGNITFKSDVGTYGYGVNAGPHAVTSITGTPLGPKSYTYDPNGNMTSRNGHDITWTSFNQVERVNGANGKFSEFFFGAGRERVKQQANWGTTVYVGSLFEKLTIGSTVLNKHYIMAPTGRIAVRTETGATVKTEYLHTDGLGSITAMTDHNGVVTKRFAFDPWGKRLHVDLTTKATTDTTTANNGDLTRGFTDHEHLDDLGLIHMNGRVYDPVLARFLSADPFVGDAGDAQEYNRYSYLGNNPLGGTDPSGYFSLKDAVKIVAVVAAAVVTAGAALAAYAGMSFGSALSMIATASFGTGWAGLANAAIAGAGAGFGSGFAGSLLNGGSIGDAFKAGIIGAAVGGVGGAITFGIGTIAGDLGYLGTAAAHGVAQGGLNEAVGGEFRHGFYAGFAAAAAGGPINQIPGHDAAAIAERVAVAAVVGGTASALGGGKFANGAVSGAFVRLFNEEATHGGFDVMNASETKGKKVVGSFVTDDSNWNRSDSYTDNLGRTHLDGTLGKRWLSEASAINAKLAVNGEAVEVALVHSRTGYENYLRSVTSGGNLRILTATFHGSGSKTDGVVWISGSGSYTKVTQPGVSWGFEARSKNLLGPNVGFYPFVCSPNDNEFNMAVGMHVLRNNLTGK